MREIQTFILRLLVDPGEPEVLRGALQPVPEGEPHPFISAQALLTLLQQLAIPLAEAPDCKLTDHNAVVREEGK